MIQFLQVDDKLIEFTYQILQSNHDKESFIQCIRDVITIHLFRMAQQIHEVSMAHSSKIPSEISDTLIERACLSYRHDFGLMTEEEREQCKFQAREWFRCFRQVLIR